MTEAVLSSMITATPFAAMLETQGVQTESAPYHGVLSPMRLDAPEAEMMACLSGAAAHDLGWLKRVAVHGEDRFRWLNGMVTNNIKDLADNSGVWNLVLNAQGQIQGDVTVWREGDNLELQIAADQYDKLMTCFDRFIIMDDVELVPLGAEAIHDAGAETTIGLSGPKASEILPRLGLAELIEPMTTVRVEWNGYDLRIRRSYGTLVQHFEICLPIAGLPLLWSSLCAAGAIPIGMQAVEALRIAEGIPVYGVDILERDLPQETSQTRALHFNKGCYLGQEIVERIRSRGNVHRHLRQLELTGSVPSAGMPLTLEDGTVVGEIRSAAEFFIESKRIFALGMIRSEAETKQQQLQYATGTAEILNAISRL